ncbi:MAG TPA: hypothetical protein VHL58_07320 [Thermoanaerobaculia bacterium]|nr:hypothetical protein [Thermoanaerobaculia bacterium]
MTKHHRILTVSFLTGLLFVFVPSANAIPAFARIHQTSCQTCHVGFPKLNPFGEAFRLNGYRMPGEMEPEEKPQSLGAEAFKKMWPKAIWPGDIPAHIPLALNIKMASVYASSLDANGRSVTKNDFQFPQEANLFSGGTLGEHMSFFSEVTWAENPDGSSGTELEHMQLHINSPFGRKHLVNFKIGKFAPDLAAGFQEMWISTDNGIETLFAFNPIGMNGGTGLSEGMGGISVPGMVKGIEIYGVGAHRFFYTFGVVNGLGPSAGGNTDGNASKDVYARVDYKFGGMGLDGDTTGVTLPPENWRERSVRVGLLGYSGNGKGIDFPMQDASGMPINIQDRTFNRAGVYGSWYFGDMNLFGVYLRGRDRLDTFGEDGMLLKRFDGNYNTWFLQSDYVILPPLQASLRYENLRPADQQAQSLRFLNASLSYFAYANVKATLEYRRDLHESKNYTLNTILRFAF